LLASLHLVAFGIGLSAVWTRARTLGGLPDPDCPRRVPRADVWWGVPFSFGLVPARGLGG